MRDNPVKIFISLWLLNLFLFLQFVGAADRLNQAFRQSKEPELRCTVVHWSLLADAEIVSTDIFIIAPGYISVRNHAAKPAFFARCYSFSFGRGPPAFHV